jgi:lauroyl/myristoyl acyltransferase
MRATGADTAPPPGPRGRQEWIAFMLGVLRLAEGIAFWLVAAPLLSMLPSRIAYRAACLRGDFMFWSWPDKRDEIMSNLRQVLGPELSEHEARLMARDVFRTRTCTIIDLMLTRGQARPLGKLVEIRGREHLDAALAGGKGAILCTPHIGSYICAHSLIHANGYPVTTIGRWWWHYPPGGFSVMLRMWDFVYARRVLRHRHGPNIEPWPGRFQVAVQAANVLYDNEVVTLCSDAPPLYAEMPRAIEVPFLGRQARLVPGVVPLAQLTGATVLITSIHRSPDYRHQVLEISPPVSMEGETAAALARCAAAMGAAIMANPVEWDFWYKMEDLARLGVLSDVTRSAVPVIEAN